MLVWARNLTMSEEDHIFNPGIEIHASCSLWSIDNIYQPFAIAPCSNTYTNQKKTRRKCPTSGHTHQYHLHMWTSTFRLAQTRLFKWAKDNMNEPRDINSLIRVNGIFQFKFSGVSQRLSSIDWTLNRYDSTSPTGTNCSNIRIKRPFKLMKILGSSTKFHDYY